MKVDKRLELVVLQIADEAVCIREILYTGEDLVAGGKILAYLKRAQIKHLHQVSMFEQRNRPVVIDGLSQRLIDALRQIEAEIHLKQRPLGEQEHVLSPKRCQELKCEREERRKEEQAFIQSLHTFGTDQKADICWIYLLMVNLPDQRSFRIVPVHVYVRFVEKACVQFRAKELFLAVHNLRNVHHHLAGLKREKL